MNIRLLISVIGMTILIFVTTSCSKEEEFANKLKQAQQMIDSNTQLALSLLDSIVSPYKMGQDAYMTFIVLQVEAKRKNNISVTEDAAIYDALNYFEHKGNAEQFAWASYYAGSVAFQQKQFDKAVECFKKSLELSDSINNELMLAKSYQHLAHVYQESNMIEEAISNYIQATKLYKSLSNTKDYEFHTVNNTGLAYEVLDKLDDAESYFIQSLQLAIGLNDKAYIGRSHYNLGLVALRKKNYNIAKQYFELAKPNLSDLTRLYVSYAQLYTETNQLDSARYYMESIKRNIPNITYNYQLAYTFDVLREYYVKEKNIDEALQYTELRDSVRNEINKIQLNEKIEKQKQKSEIEAYYKSVSHKNRMNAAISLIVILALISFTIYVVLMRRISKMNFAIQTSNSDIRHQLVDFLYFNNAFFDWRSEDISAINPSDKIAKHCFDRKMREDVKSYIKLYMKSFNSCLADYLIEVAQKKILKEENGKVALEKLSRKELITLMCMYYKLPTRICKMVLPSIKNEKALLFQYKLTINKLSKISFSQKRITEMLNLNSSYFN